MKQKIKIVFIISTLTRGGPPNVLAGILKHLDKSIFDPVVITLSKDKEGCPSWTTEFGRWGVEVVCLHLPYKKGLWKARKYIQETIHNINPDLIHTHCFRSTLCAALFLKKYKRVAAVHCDYEEDFKMTYGFFMGYIMAKIFRWALARVDKRVCCSEMLSHILRQKDSTVEFDYVNNGVNTNVFYPIADKRTLRRELGLPENKVIFIWAAWSFSERKDPVTLAKAIRKISSQNAFFVFCGTCDQLCSQCRTILRSCNNVQFVGFTDNLKEYMQAADCYISTSLSEGFHLTVYEALACGLEIILTDLEIYQNIKRAGLGLFFSPGSEEELGKQISFFMTHREKFASDDFVQFIRKSFSTEVMSQRYQEYYRRLVKI